MKKQMALLLALLLVLCGFAALAEAEPVQGLELVPVDEGLALDELEIGEVELGDIAELALQEADGLLPGAEAGESADVSNEGERVKINSSNFPDKNFRSYVKTAYDLDGDGALSDGERLPVDFMRIGHDEGCVLVKCQNMKGLQFFPNLASLCIASSIA